MGGRGGAFGLRGGVGCETGNSTGNGCCYIVLGCQKIICELLCIKLLTFSKKTLDSDSISSKKGVQTTMPDNSALEVRMKKSTEMYLRRELFCSRRVSTVSHDSSLPFRYCRPDSTCVETVSVTTDSFLSSAGIPDNTLQTETASTRTQSTQSLASYIYDSSASTGKRKGRVTYDSFCKYHNPVTGLVCGLKCRPRLDVSEHDAKCSKHSKFSANKCMNCSTLLHIDKKQFNLCYACFILSKPDLYYVNTSWQCPNCHMFVNPFRMAKTQALHVPHHIRRLHLQQKCIIGSKEEIKQSNFFGKLKITSFTSFTKRGSKDS